MLHRPAIGVLALLLALPGYAQQQSSAPPPDQSVPRDQKDQPDPKKQSPKDQSPKDQGPKGPDQKDQDRKSGQGSDSPPAANPFPQQQSEDAARQQNQPPSAPQPATPAHKSTADQNPFPEEQSERAAHEAEHQTAPQPDHQAEPGSDSSSSHVKDLDLSGLGDPRTSNGSGGTVLSPELARKDAKVGHFYLESGDYKGAYDRFAEAARVDPGNADAIFGLAEAARHLNRRDEAVSNYQLYLSALPDGPRSKDARKALKELGAAPPRS